MISNYLLPNKYKKVGWFLLVPSLILGVLFTFDIAFEIKMHVFAIWVDDVLQPWQMFTMIEQDIYNDIVGCVLLISLALIAFAKEKNEDEYISKIRLDSLLWAVYINYALLFLAIVFVHGLAFTTIMIYNMYTILLIFIIRFNCILFKSNRVEE